MATNPLKNKKVLITCGPTWVPVDDMRVLSNRSSGRLGHLLAEKFQKEGSRVTLLEGPVQKPFVSKTARIVPFKFYEELLSLFKTELRKKPDIVIHAAAVADYKTKKAFKGKISSNLPSLKIVLVPTIKIINLIKHLSPKTFLVGFKLEAAINEALARKKTQKLFKSADCDLVLVNSVKNSYRGLILDPSLNILAEGKNRRQISSALIKILKKTLCTDSSKII